MALKNVLMPHQTVTDGDMGAASVTSPVTNIKTLDNVSIFCVWTTTGTPVGTLAVQASLDYSDGISSPAAAGNWTTVTSTDLTGGSPALFDLNQLSFPYVRLVYTRSSGGTGAKLQVYIAGKGLQ